MFINNIIREYEYQRYYIYIIYRNNIILIVHMKYAIYHKHINYLQLGEI